MKGTITISSGAATALVRSNLSGRDSGHVDIGEGQASAFHVTTTDHVVLKNAAGTVAIDDAMDYGVSIVKRNNKTGVDEGTETVEPGSSGSFTADDDFDAVIMPVPEAVNHASHGQIGAAMSPEDATKAEENDSEEGEDGEDRLTDATDDDFKTALADPSVQGDGGKVDLTKLNEYLTAKGFNTISQQKLTALSKASA